MTRCRRWPTRLIWWRGWAITGGIELRCHELARAVARGLVHRGHSGVTVIDGQLYMIEHSWLLLPPSRLPAAMRPALLDVYCPGRLPQVQLIDDHFVVSRGYKAGKPRTDIRERIVALVSAEIGPRR